MSDIVETNNLPTDPAPVTPPVGTTPPAPVTTEPLKPAETLIGEPKAPAEPPAPVEPVVPLTVEALTLPEGFTLDPETSGQFVEILNDPALSKADLAQRLLDLQISREKTASEKASQAWTEMQDQWRGEVTNDPEIGGAKLAENLAGINKLVDAYGSNELRQAFDFTGAGNNPHVIRFLSKIAKELNEGGLISRGSPDARTSALSALYPSMKA